MDFIKQTEAIQWKEGKYKKIEETVVNDKYTYLVIDSLNPRKFSTYPKNLDDFAVGYCLGEGLIKDYSDITSIKIDKTNILIKTKAQYKAPENLEKKNCKDKPTSELLEYQLNSDSAGGIRSELKQIPINKSDLKINATQVIKDIKYLTNEAKTWQKTGGVHVAQLKYENNTIIREDVSRHVAVDKVIGAASKKGFDFSKSYITYSGRMPADMLRKVIRVGIPVIISNASPAYSGLEVAKNGNITMIGFVRNKRFTIYNAPERIDLDK